MKVRNIKTLFRSGIIRQKFFAREASYESKTGLEALILIEEVDRPKIISAGGRNLVISDVGYLWYQLALRDSFYWLSAAFNDKGELIELYFDITDGNRFDDSYNPEFTDMFLDVVVTPDGGIRILDRDELDEALSAGAITEREYADAIAHCEELCNLLSNSKFSIIEYCKSEMSQMKEFINSGEEQCLK